MVQIFRYLFLGLILEISIELKTYDTCIYENTQTYENKKPVSTERKKCMETFLNFSTKKYKESFLICFKFVFMKLSSPKANSKIKTEVRLSEILIAKTIIDTKVWFFKNLITPKTFQPNDSYSFKSISDIKNKQIKFIILPGFFEIPRKISLVTRKVESEGSIKGKDDSDDDDDDDDDYGEREDIMTNRSSIFELGCFNILFTIDEVLYGEGNNDYFNFSKKLEPSFSFFRKENSDSLNLRKDEIKENREVKNLPPIVFFNSNYGDKKFEGILYDRMEKAIKNLEDDIFIIPTQKDKNYLIKDNEKGDRMEYLVKIKTKEELKLNSNRKSN